MWRLARRSGSLDVNSPYAYLLVCSDFAATSIVAEDDTGLLGYVAAYRPPGDPTSLFVWQVTVASTAQGRGLASRLLKQAISSQDDLRWLTATVTPGNHASLRLFQGLARELGVGCREQVRFPAELFPEEVGDHAPEMQLRIGPLRPPDTDPGAMDPDPRTR